MAESVQSVDRPDVNGTPAKMAAICEAVIAALAGCQAGWSKVTASDNIMSGVTIRGTVEPKDQWSNGIFHNAHYWIFHVFPMKGKRYYDPADPKVTVELGNSGIGMGKFRKYTGPVEKVTEKLRTWIAAEMVKA
jgi:hypothetical protein